MLRAKSMEYEPKLATRLGLMSFALPLLFTCTLLQVSSCIRSNCVATISYTCQLLLNRLLAPQALPKGT